MEQTFVDFVALARVQTETRAYRAGDIIFKAGDLARELYLIKEGSVSVSIGTHHVATLGEGEIFGEMALVGRQSRSANAIARTDCVLIPVTEKQFLIMVRAAPNFAIAIMRTMAQRLRNVEQSQGEVN